MTKRARGWLSWLGDIAHAVKSDPVLLAPATLVVGLAVLFAYVAWRFL